VNNSVLWNSNDVTWLLSEYKSTLQTKGKSPATIYAYLCDLRVFARWAETESIPLLSVKTSAIQTYLNKQLETGKKVSSVERYRAALESFYGFVAKLGLMAENPVEGTKFPVVARPKESIKFLDPELIEKILTLPDQTTATGYRDHLILKLLYETGIRSSELISLKLTDIDLDKKTVRVHFRGKNRVLPLSQTLASKLKLYLSPHGERDELFQSQPSPFLFVNQFGRQITRQVLCRWLKDYGDLLDVKLTPSALRHAYARLMRKNGVSIELLTEVLGNKDVDQTDKYYGHIKKAPRPLLEGAQIGHLTKS
jgi:integrase/recombinase XerD